MKTEETLKNADSFLNELLIQTDSVPCFGKSADKKLKGATLKIRNNLKVDYSVPVNFKSQEKERLIQIYVNFLTGKSDDFNSHYIQLLAWHLVDLKIMKNKSGKIVSIFEYSPNPLAIYTVIERTFKLFNKKRIKSNKIAFALLLNYLNNYRVASNRYKNELRKYLKSIRFSKYVDIFFTKDIVYYSWLKCESLNITFPERLLKLGLDEKILDSVYFSDAWFLWMISSADLTDEINILKKINCIYFKNCNDVLKKILFANIIKKNCMLLNKNFGILKYICEEYIFPLIKNGDPLKENFWIVNYEGKFHEYVTDSLQFAWNFISTYFCS